MITWEETHGIYINIDQDIQFCTTVNGKSIEPQNCILSQDSFKYKSYGHPLSKKQGYNRYKSLLRPS